MILGLVVLVIEAPLFIHTVSLILDAPGDQNLVFFLEQIIEVFDDTDRILGLYTDADSIVGYKSGRINVLVLDAFVEHDRQWSITLFVNTSCLQIFGGVAHLPGIVEITEHPSGGDLCQILVFVHGEGFRIE
ncbi:hypothetical protein D3C75_872950 [compost metagenome]